MSGGMDTLDVCRMIRARCDRAGGQRAWAEATGLSESYVSDVLNARREPGESILRALGLRRVFRYVESRKSGDAHG
jgi:hypothetical protein